MAAVGPLWHSGAPPSRPRGMPLGARIHFATAGHGAFCFAVTLGVTSLCSRGFAKPEVAYCANRSVGPQEKQRGSQESQPRQGTRRQHWRFQSAQLERTIDAPSMGRRCV